MIVKTKTDRTKIQRSLLGYPYFIINKEIPATEQDHFRKELIEIKDKYCLYRDGVPFLKEGTNGDYVPSDLSFKITKTLIDKEARFMFSQQPEFRVESRVSEDKEKPSVGYQRLIQDILTRCNFSRDLLRAAKDCFIGKRVACLVDISEQDGIQIHFYDSLHFYFEKGYGTDRITKFIAFEEIKKSRSGKVRRILCTKYTEKTEGNVTKVYVESVLYDGSGEVVEDVIPETETQLDYIPAVVIVNDGLLADTGGVSEVDDLEGYEETYSWIANADVDSERKGMNPKMYTIDMDPDTTKNIPTGPGAYMDLQSDQNLSEPHPSIGMLSPNLGHTEAVKETLNRIKLSAYQAVDVPNISEETMVGSVTSGKTLKALYWPLIVRCDEKMKTWRPALVFVAQTIIDYARAEKELVEEFYGITGLSDTQVNVRVQEKYALLDDEAEEKGLDMEEIAQNTRSRKSYLKKWRSEEFQSDEKIEEELMQIAIELSMFDTMSPNVQVQNELSRKSTEGEIDSAVEGINAQSSLEG